MNVATEGENGPDPSIPGLDIKGAPNGFRLDNPACGVPCMVSSSSAWTIIASSSEDVLPDSESIILTLPIELEIAVLSGIAIVDQSEFAALPGESGTEATLEG